MAARAGIITAAATTSFLDGQHWAYLTGSVAIVLGAALVFFMFPTKDEEDQLLEAHHRADMSAEVASANAEAAAS